MSTHETVSAARLSHALGLHRPTAEQAAVIESALAPAVVIAGAGAGKTETMAARVVWLVANRLVTPGAVLGLTFTRKAAAELGGRIRRRLAQWRHVVEREWPDDEQYLAVLRSGEPTVSTYAAYAGRLVGEHALRLGAEPDSRLLSPAQCWQLAAGAVRGFDGSLPAGIGQPASVIKYVRAMADQFADHLVTADDVAEFSAHTLAAVEALGSTRRSGPVADFVKALEQREALLPLVRRFCAGKAAAGAVDFGDQMGLAARLAELPEVRSVERERYAAVLLDEYQDTGHSQAVLLHALFGQAHPVTAVGDPFQSIYGWRGASAGNIEAFSAMFSRADGTPASVYPMATSFRNDRAILAAANAVATPLRSGPTTVELLARDGAGAGLVEVARTETQDDEAQWVAARMRRAWDALPSGGGRARTAAVLVRRRSQIPVLAEALSAVGLPVEVVGLGGLLTTPEVADVVATLRVLADHDAVPSLARLLTGARWRIGPRDLAALHARARMLSRIADPEAAADEDDRFTLIEALDDLGPAGTYSTAGYVRLAAFSTELRRLRRRIGGPLPDLIAEIERVSRVDIEVGARSDAASAGGHAFSGKGAIGRVHLDRFLDEAADFAAEAGDPSGATLTAFLAFLDAAEEEENGLEAGEASVVAERVQVLTVHGAKGLEWDVVAVPGLVDGCFPAAAKATNWTRTRQELPIPLRGDRADLPDLALSAASTAKELQQALEQHDEDLRLRHAKEERRLAYVACTRARSVLIASGYVWDAAVRPREVSPFLQTLREHADLLEWFEPKEGATNPVLDRVRSALWPADPFGPADAGAERRRQVEAAAELVRCAGRADAPPGPAASAHAAVWARDVDVLLAERARLARGDEIVVDLPAHLSVSQLVELERHPANLARRLRRPLPQAPAPLARRGTRFHAWLEQRWQAQALLDVDELPGSSDAAVDDEDFEALREAFERSEWAERTPAEVEVPFEMALDGTVVRGRMDAVFGSAEAGWEIVDWKTGARPGGADAAAAAVQLAAYRLAWARLRGIADADLHRVRAAFHYVRSNETVAPADLLDAAGLRVLITGAGNPAD